MKRNLYGLVFGQHDYRDADLKRKGTKYVSHTVKSTFSISGFIDRGDRIVRNRFVFKRAETGATEAT